MTPDRRRLLAAAALRPGTAAAAAREPAAPRPPVFAPRIPVDPGRAPDTVVDLWQGRPPGGEAVVAWGAGPPPPRPALHGDIRGYARPVLAGWRPERPDGSAILVLPGGGYGFVSWDNEGASVARILLPTGAAVFVLAYRVPGDRLGWADEADAPLADAQRALRLVRAEAAARGRDPARIGVLGFSAGGHLAGRLATEPDRATYAAVDAADRLSARPTFAGLLYPVVTLLEPYAHTGSRRALIGEDAARAQALSVQTHVSAATPPTFIAQCLDDDTVDPDNALIFEAALRRAGVASELHLFGQGGHGFGVSVRPDLPAALWPELFTRWRRLLP